MNSFAPFRQFRSVIGATVFFSALVNLLLFTSPLYMMSIYDRVLSSRSVPTLLVISAIAVYLILLQGAIEYIRSAVLIRAGKAFEAETRMAVGHATIALQGQHPDQASQLQRDADIFREFAAGAGIIAFLDAPWAPVFVLVCFVMHPLIGVVALLGALILFTLALVSARMTRKPLLAATEAAHQSLSELSAMMRSHEVLRANGMVDAALRRWSVQREALIGLQGRASDLAGAVLAVTKFVRLILQVGILGIGAWLAISDAIAGGAIFAASLVMGRALSPVEQAVAHWKNFVQARQAYRRLSAVLAKPAAKRETTLPAPEGRLSIENLFVVAPGTHTAILRGVTFSAAPGEVIVVVGQTGAGKSTLLKAIAAVLPAASGAVRYDNHEIPEYDPEILGRAVGYLPQSVDLFPGTVAANIARLDDPDYLASSEGTARVLRAAQLAGVDEMIARMPQGFATQVGPGGMSLSGGQCQRIGLARALYGDPSVLILDEPNSNLDPIGDRALAEAIMHARSRKATILVSSHKPELLQCADHILVLENGQVKAFGPRAAILNALNSRAPARPAAATA